MLPRIANSPRGLFKIFHSDIPCVLLRRNLRHSTLMLPCISRIRSSPHSKTVEKRAEAMWQVWCYKKIKDIWKETRITVKVTSTSKINGRESQPTNIKKLVEFAFSTCNWAMRAQTQTVWPFPPFSPSFLARIARHPRNSLPPLHRPSAAHKAVWQIWQIAQGGKRDFRPVKLNGAPLPSCPPPPIIKVAELPGSGGDLSAWG